MVRMTCFSRKEDSIPPGLYVSKALPSQQILKITFAGQYNTKQIVNGISGHDASQTNVIILNITIHWMGHLRDWSMTINRYFFHFDIQCRKIREGTLIINMNS